MEKRIRESFAEITALQSGFLAGEGIMKLKEAAEAIIASMRVGGKLLIAGNGGSAADAQHFAAELVGKYLRVRKAIPAIALTTDTSILTSIANDISYAQVFVRQLEALTKKEDIFFAISTSGNSQNLLEALQFCKKENIYTIGLAGEGGGAMQYLVDILIEVPSKSTPRIQEVHATIIHVLSELIESAMTKEA